MLTFPRPLKPGDEISIVAPSGVVDRERFMAGVQILRGAGFEPVFDEGVFAKHRYLAGDDDRRLAELQNALLNPNTRAIWTARGGYGATRLLTRLAPEIVTQAGKWLVGFSDTSALHALWLRAGLASCHGSNITTLPVWTQQARAELWAMLMGDAPVVYRGRALTAGPSVEGMLVGGNLTVLAAMVGTPHVPSFKDCIVLLEDIGERPYRLDRTLVQMIDAGAFNDVRGFAVGQLTDCDEPGDNGLSGLTVVMEILGSLGVPVLGELPLGHDASSRAALLGAHAKLSTQEQTLQVGRVVNAS